MKANNNDLTLRTYEAKMQEYIAGTPSIINEAEEPWIDHSLSLIPTGGKILELGSGFGRNAAYIERRGYMLECTDAVPSFVALMKDEGLNAHVLDVLKDDVGRGYDMVFANGVLVHFTPEETARILDKIQVALKGKGIFAFSVKQGDGGKWTEEKLNAPRYFQYWHPEALRELVEKHGFEWLNMTSGETSDKKGGWLYITARKASK